MEMENELIRVDELLSEIEVKTKQLHEMIQSTNYFLYKSLRKTPLPASALGAIFPTSNVDEFEKLYQMEITNAIKD